MRKLYIKIIAFISVIVCSFLFLELLSVKSMSANSEYYDFTKEVVFA